MDLLPLEFANARSDRPPAARRPATVPTSTRSFCGLSICELSNPLRMTSSLGGGRALQGDRGGGPPNRPTTPSGSRHRRDPSRVTSPKAHPVEGTATDPDGNAAEIQGSGFKGSRQSKFEALCRLMRPTGARGASGSKHSRGIRPAAGAFTGSRGPRSTRPGGATAGRTCEHLHRSRRRGRASQAATKPSHSGSRKVPCGRSKSHSSDPAAPRPSAASAGTRGSLAQPRPFR